MRSLLAVLALAGAMTLACSAALAQGASAHDLTRAARCPAPMSCEAGRIAAGNLPATLLDMVDAEAARQGVPQRMARALVRVESGFNPHARNGAALGLTQIKCRTATGLGFRGPCAALLDPATNLRWGLMHARRALDRGSIGFHETGLGARRVRAAYVRKINAAM